MRELELISRYLELDSTPGPLDMVAFKRLRREKAQVARELTTSTDEKWQAIGVLLQSRGHADTVCRFQIDQVVGAALKKGGATAQ